MSGGAGEVRILNFGGLGFNHQSQLESADSIFAQIQKRDVVATWDNYDEFGQEANVGVFDLEQFKKDWIFLSRKLPNPNYSPIQPPRCVESEWKRYICEQSNFPAVWDEMIKIGVAHRMMLIQAGKHELWACPIYYH